MLNFFFLAYPQAPRPTATAAPSSNASRPCLKNRHSHTYNIAPAQNWRIIQSLTDPWWDQVTISVSLLFDDQAGN